MPETSDSSLLAKKRLRSISGKENYYFYFKTADTFLKKKNNKTTKLIQSAFFSPNFDHMLPNTRRFRNYSYIDEFCLRLKSIKMFQCYRRVTLKYYLLTPRSRILLEKLTGFATSPEIPHYFMEPESSLPYSKVSDTCPYPSPLHPVPIIPSHFPKIHLNIIPHLLLVLPSGLFPSGFPTKTMCTPLPFPIRAPFPIQNVQILSVSNTIKFHPLEKQTLYLSTHPVRLG
jgi:hypothetical protein